MTTYCKPLDEAVDAIMGATRPMLKRELERLLGDLYNAGYDDGRERGYEMCLVDQALAEDD